MHIIHEHCSGDMDFISTTCVRRRDESHITRSVLDMEVEGVRPTGRTKLRYMDTIKRDIKKNGLTDVNILDRNDLRMAVSRVTRCHGRAFKVNR